MIVIDQVTPNNVGQHLAPIALLMSESEQALAVPASYEPEPIEEAIAPYLSGGKLLIAYEKGKPVGCLALKRLDTNRAQIEQFRATGKQSEEIADLLLLKAIECGRRLGLDYLQADKASLPMQDVAYTPSKQQHEPAEQLYQLDLRDRLFC